MPTSQTNTTESSTLNGESYHLSYQQRRLWQSTRSTARTEQTASVPSSQCVLRIEGELDAARLRKALQQVVDRHDILRTTFHVPAGLSLPAQVVAPHGSAEWRETDLLHCQSGLRDAEIEACCDLDLRRTFPLAEGPLLRASLLALARDEHVLILTLPALCADAASLLNLAQELRTAYASDQRAEEPEAPIQYIQLTEWQQSQQDGEDAEPGKEYWRGPRALPHVELPLQRPPRDRDTFVPSFCAVPIPPQIAASLQRFERVDSILFGCWLTLLWRVSGQSPVRVGITCHGRSFEELHGAMGPVARVVPLSSALQEGMHFRNLATSLAAKLDEAEDWQEYYESSSGEGQCEAACFEWNEFPVDATFPGVRLNLVKLQSNADRCHIRLSITRTGEVLLARLDYDPLILAPDYVERLAAQLNTLLCSAVDCPDALVEQLVLLSEDERRFVVEKCNDTRSAYPSNVWLHQLFAAQAVSNPHRIAVTFGDASLTYSELDKRANQLAHRLRELHVGPEIRVGIYMHRSLEMMIGLLAILKAGGAYVPLDPVYPPERLAFMLADSQVPALLTDSRLRPLLPDADSLQILCLDDFDQVAGAYPCHEPYSGVCADNLAYTLYTSGSTGKPKGALIPHRGLVNYLSWCTKAYDVESSAGTAVHSSIGFDATITALFPPLLVGRSVELVREGEGVDGLCEAMERSEGFSLIKITPAHLSLLNEAIAESNLAAKARLLVIGGDALSGGRLTPWHERASQTRFINEYGPTETVVGCCVHEANETDLAADSVPIGRPIANTQLHVLDSRFMPQPTGIPGELYIGGDGVSRGYLGRPALTAERFLPDPFSAVAGARLYRTGDLTVRFPDGILNFLGRLDHQVKIRSYRIELGEIEAQLEQHAMVTRSVVTANTESSGEKSLVAYIQPSTTTEPLAEELRAFLLTRLPEHMVPAVFVTLDALPLTAHGKVDRNALPDPKTLRASTAEPYAAPQTPTEQTLAEIWCKVLRLDRIGIHDDFFRSGGDSILSILVVARSAKAGIRFTTRDLFQHPTIAGLASLAPSTAPATSQGAVDGTVPLTPIQHWFFEREFPNPHHFNQSVLLEVDPGLSIDVLRRAIEQLVAHHDALRLRFTQDRVGEAASWRQTHAIPEGTAQVSEVDLAGISTAEQQSTIAMLAEEAQSGLKLSNGPILRGVLTRFSNNSPTQLLLAVHHLVVDGVSWRILLDDLSTICRQLANNEPIQLPAKTASFKDWATWLREYSTSETLAAESDYWLRQTGNSVSLPIDLPSQSDSNTVSSCSRVKAVLSRRQTSALLHEASDAYRAQIDDFLLTALVQACAGWTGSRSLLIDLESHGRPGGQSEETLCNELDVSRTVGWFTSIFPLHLELENQGYGQALKAIKEQLRHIPNRGIGYGVLRYLSPNAALREQFASLPTPQISFNYLGSVDGLAAEPILGVASETPGAEVSPASKRLYLLDVLAQVKDGCLQLEIIYSNALHRRTTMQNLADNFLECLEALLDHCLSPDAGGFTPSDFPEAGLSQEELDRLVADLG
jgi:amino acid adenylation domain-containing protein/non-ribosomal peptide synthase protein (TIGR01720 family)